MKNPSEAPIVMNGYQSPPIKVCLSPSTSSSSPSPTQRSPRCSVCSETVSPSFNLEDPLKICAVCDVCVHSSCYGTDVVENENVTLGQWRCRFCSATKSESVAKSASEEKSKVCLFCTLPEGAYTRVSTGQWAHIVCCLFIPEVFFVDPITMDEAVIPKDEGFRTLSQKTCSICDKASGVCRRCDDEECETYFHVTCGQALGLLVFESHSDGMLKFAGYCQMHRLVYQSRSRPNHQWLTENSTALSADDIINVASTSRRIVKKIIYRLAKDLAKTCPHEGTKGTDVNGWYNDGCKEFFHKHPNLDRKGINTYIRNCGLGFYHGCLRRKFSSKLLKTSSTDCSSDEKSAIAPSAN